MSDESLSLLLGRPRLQPWHLGAIENPGFSPWGMPSFDQPQDFKGTEPIRQTLPGPARERATLAHAFFQQALKDGEY
jgi:hypothetical protein